MIPFIKSIGFRLLGVSIILLSLPLLVDSFIFLENHYKKTTERARAALTEQINMRTSSFVEFQSNVNKVFEMLLYFLELEKELNDHGGKLNEELSNLASINNDYAVIVMEVTKKHTLHSIGSNLTKFQDKDLTTLFMSPDPFSPKEDKRGYVISFFRDPQTNQTYQYVAKGIFSREKEAIGVLKEPIGVLVVIRDVESTASLLLKPDQIPYKINFALLLPSSIVFDSSDPSFRFQYFHELSVDQLSEFSKIEPMSVLGKTPLLTSDKIHFPYVVFEWNGEKQLGIESKLTGTDNSLIAYTSLSDLIHRPLNDFILYYGSFIIIFIIGIILAYIGTRRLAMPISALSLVMHKIKEGEVESRYEKQYLGFEINRIGLIFNDMVDALIKNKRAIEEERIIKETFAKELDLGRDVQESILPRKMPHVRGVSLGQAFVPAVQVGGDFYDAYVKENGKLMVTVADASGKGVRACCYALSVKSMLKALGKQSDDVAEVSRITNNLFCEDTGGTGMFVTVMLGQYDPKTRILDYYSSGHNALIHYSLQDQSVRMLEFLDMAMGVVKKSEIKQAGRITLKPGDLVLLYSDGVTEAHNPHNELYGDERLIQFVKTQAYRGAQEFASCLIEQVASFKAEAQQHDDITLMVLKIE